MIRHWVYTENNFISAQSDKQVTDIACLLFTSLSTIPKSSYTTPLASERQITTDRWSISGSVVSKRM